MSQDSYKEKGKLNESVLVRTKPTLKQIDYLTYLLDKELEIKKGSLIRTTFDFTLIVTSDDDNSNDTKKMNFIKFNKDSVLMFLELIYDEANRCLAAKVINNDKVCIISFATFEEMRNINAVTEANFIDFFSCLLIKWEP
jgi:hypothetical protein